MMKSVQVRELSGSDLWDDHAESGMNPTGPGRTKAAGGHAADDGRALAGTKLLIVEDEYLIGLDLAHGPRSEGMDVLGPYASIASAIDVLDTTDGIGAAILDFNIRGRVAFDLAERLVERNIPFVFYTGYESVIVPEKLRKVGRVRKPADWPEIRKALFGENRDPLPTRRLVKQFDSDAPGLSSLLPALRKRARAITPNAEMAEHLVERTLERAIAEIAACPDGIPMEHWLIGLLESTGIGDSHYMN